MVLLTVATSCDKENNEPGKAMFINFATYLGSSGSTSSYAVYPSPNDSITLTASKAIPADQLTAGRRVLIMFQTATNAWPERPGDIQLQGIGVIPNAKLRSLPADSIRGWNEIETYAVSLRRCGPWIDLTAMAQPDPALEGSRYELWLDSATASDSYPDLYLVNNSEGNYAYARSESYVSFNIASVLDKPSVEGVRIHLNNSNVPTDSIFIFEKQ